MKSDKNILIYSFRTFPDIQKIKDFYGKVFIFEKLKENLKTFLKIIDKEKPDYILGLAINKNSSKLEKLTINKVNKGKVSKTNLKDKIELFIPKEIFEINTIPTTSFCNWTMWKIGEYLLEKNLNTRLSFVHINLKDLDKIKVFLLDSFCPPLKSENSEVRDDFF
jgi:pyrrolidone-carboxylate peptidase